MRLGTADVLVRAKTGQYKKDLKTAEARTKAFGQNATKSVNSVVGSFASLAGVAGVGGLTASLIKTGADFESQMATVQGVMRASQDDYDLLAAAAKKMGAETEWSATKSAEALEFMGLAGWNVQKSIAGLPGMLNAATAAGKDLGTVSDILTDSLTAMGMEIEEIDRLTDVMTGTTTRANTDFLQFGEAMKEAAPYARAYGYEIEEVAALIGIVADAGIKGSDAGTGLKNTWINNKKAAKELGTEATDLIGTLRAANAAQWDTNKFAEVYGKIAGKTVLNIAANIEKYEALADTLHDVSGETKELAAIKLDTLIGDFKILKSTLEGVGLAAYDSLKEDLREGVQDLTKLVQDNKEDLIDFAETSRDLAVDLGKIGVHAASLLKNVVDGWNSLPTIIQEMGLVGALIGGAKARAALLLIGAAITEAEKLNALVSNVGNTDKLKGVIQLEENRLKRLKENYADLKGKDIEEFGPGYIEQIKNAEQHLSGLYESLNAAKMSLRNPDDWRAMKRSLEDGFKDLSNVDPIEMPVQPVLDSSGDNKKTSSTSKWAQWQLDVKALHVAEVQRAQALQDSIELQNVLAEAMDDTYDLDYGSVTDGLYDLEEVAVETADTMKDAFSGWASNMATDLNDLFWESDATFSDIAESYARMLTQMINQKYIAEPFMKFFTGGDDGDGLLDSLFKLNFGGSGGSGSFDPFGSLSSFGGGSYWHGGGIVGADSTRSAYGINPAVFAGAPRFHTGLMPDEFPAILQKGEGVFTQEQMEILGGAQGGQPIYNIYINAMDSQSIHEALKRNPAAVVGPVVDSIKGNAQMRKAMKGTM